MNVNISGPVSCKLHFPVLFHVWQYYSAKNWFLLYQLFFILNGGFTIHHTASVVENLQLKAIMVDDKMINVQVTWNGRKITVEGSPAYVYMQPQ